MPESNLVVLQSDADIERSLVSAFTNLAKHVRATRCMTQLRDEVTQTHAKIVVLDMEAASIAEIEQFVRDFPFVRLVCNHRLADDEVWKAAMNAGAEDCCSSRDMRGILNAAGLSTGRSLQAAA
jgi:hypothetical protein